MSGPGWGEYGSVKPEVSMEGESLRKDNWNLGVLGEGVTWKFSALETFWNLTG